ncbi:MAG: transposase [Cytophagales bacterium]|nr:transposase [Cytophagales bacterium]
MLGKAPNQDQRELFKATLKQIIDPKHPLAILAQAIPWKRLEEKFEHLYSHTGAPSHHFRKMTGILLLQRIYHFSDERVVALWRENPYFQYFCGETSFQWEQPCAASDLVHFRKRLGKEGIEALFALSVPMHGNKLAKAKEVLGDTTVQEKNITYPTDAKRYKKVIERCTTLAQRVGVQGDRIFLLLFSVPLRVETFRNIFQEMYAW